MYPICGVCGKVGHNLTTCTNPSDGFGNFMTYNDQQKSLKEGYLVISIGFPGQTHLPESLQEFYSMRNKSNLPSSIFSENKTSMSDNLPDTISFQEMGNQDVASSNVESSIDLTPQDNLSYKINDKDVGSIHEDMDFSIEENQVFTVEENQVSTVDCNEVDNVSEEGSGLFEYPSDQSHYSLDQRKRLRQAQSMENFKWNKAKLEQQRYELFHPNETTEDGDKSKEPINVGDVITYVPLIHVQVGNPVANKHYRVESMVESVNPQEKNGFKLKLHSDDRIEHDTRIVSTQINYKGTLIKHPGRCRMLENYTLTTQGNSMSLDSLDRSGEYSRFNLKKSVRKSLESTPAHLRNLTEGITEDFFKKAQRNHDKGTKKRVKKGKQVKKTKTTFHPKKAKKQKSKNTPKRNTRHPTNKK